MEKGDKIIEGFVSDEIGYSEAKVDHDIELQAGQWLDFQSVSLSSPKNTSLKKSLIDLFERNNSQLQNVSEEALVIVQKGGVVSDELTDVIIYLQDIQASLLRILSRTDVPSWARLPKEVQNLLE